MAQDQKQCITCGKLFKPCPRCEDKKESYEAQYGFAPWRTVACSVECYQVYDVLRRYNYGQLPIIEAKALLGGIDMPEIERPEVKALIDKILAHKVARTKPPKAEAPDEDEMK